MKASTCTACSVSKQEESEHFFICFVRSGYYEQRIFNDEHEVHAGRILLSKPNLSYTIRHIDDQPDRCTIIRFSNEFYEQVKQLYKKQAHWFFSNRDIQSVVLKSQADIEFIHRQILDTTNTVGDS